MHVYEVCFYPRDQYTYIVLHDKSPRAARRDVLISLTEFSLPSLFLSLSLTFFLLCPFYRDFRFRTANQPTTTRYGYRNGADGSGTFNRSSKQSATGPAIRDAFRQLRGKENRVETLLVAFLMWPSVQAMNLSCVNRFASFTFPDTHVLLFSLSLFLFPFLFLFLLHTQTAFCCSLWKSLRADASSYQSAESVNRWDNVFQPVYTTTTAVHAILAIYFLFFLHSVSPLLPRVWLFRPAYLYDLGLPVPRAFVGKAKFNENQHVKSISDYFFQFN